MRVRRGSAEQAVGLMRQAEVAAFMHISERAVRDIERRAFDKIRRHPGLRDFWREWLTGEVEESASQALADCVLTRAEIAAVYALAQTPEERQVLRKLLVLRKASATRALPAARLRRAERSIPDRLSVPPACWLLGHGIQLTVPPACHYRRDAA